MSTVESSYDLRTQGFSTIAGVAPTFAGSAAKSAIFGRYGFAVASHTVISVDLVTRQLISTIVLPVSAA